MRARPECRHAVGRLPVLFRVRELQDRAQAPSRRLLCLLLLRRHQVPHDARGAGLNDTALTRHVARAGHGEPQTTGRSF